MSTYSKITKHPTTGVYEKALLVVHKDYQLVYEYRDKSVDQKAKALNRSLYMFIISAILLIVLKIGG